MNISSNNIMTSFIEKPSVRAVNYLKSYLSSELWAKCYMSDEDFTKKQKLENTKKYIDNLLKNNCVMRVDYHRSDAETLGIGRIYGSGVQNIPSAFRGLLFRDNTTDIDIINAHPSILLHLCETKGIMCNYLKEYCDTRDVLLATGKATKKSIIVSIFDSKKIGTTIPFMNMFDNEMKLIQSALWTDPEYSLIRDSIHPQKPNKVGTFMAYVLQSIERKIINCVGEFMTENGIEICANMFDGLLIYSTDFTDCLRLNEYVKDNTGFPVRFITKPHDTSLSIPDDFVYANDEELYSSMKEHYETNFNLAFIQSTASYAYKNGNNIMFFKKNDMSQILYPIKVGKKRFFDLWCDDASRRSYASIGMYPHDVVCPPTILNLWNGFAVERMPDCEYCDFSVILQHIMILCNHDGPTYEFMMDWIANMFQYPSQQSPMPVIYSESGGTGKSSLIRILSAMVGDDKSLPVSDVKRDLFGSFNGHLQNIFLLNIDEPNPKDAHQYHEQLKTLIDGSILKIDNKGMTSFSMPNTLHIIGTTNNVNAFKIKDEDRRIFQFETSEELIGQDDYLAEFNEIPKNEAMLKSFHKYLMERKVKRKLTKLDFPQSELMEEIKSNNREPFKDFMDSLSTGDYKSNELYIRFRQYSIANGLNQDWIPTQKTFLNNVSRYAKKKNITMVKKEETITDEETGTKSRHKYTLYKLS